MRSISCATAIALTLTAAGVAPAQAPLKIAYVNTQVIFEAAPGKAAADSLLNKEGQGFQAQLQKMQDSINGLYSAYQKAEPTLSAAAKDLRQKAIQGLETDYQAQNLKFQQQFQARQNEVMAPIQEQVRKVLDDIRAEDGYSLILDHTPGQSPIVSADKNLDITDRVVARLRTLAAVAPKPATTNAKPTAPGTAGVTKPPKPPTK